MNTFKHKYFIVSLSIVIILVGLVFYGFVSIFSNKAEKNIGNLFVVDDTSKTQVNSYKHDNDYFVPLKKIPENIKNAFIAAQDDDFYNHSGVDYSKLVKNILNPSTKLESISTITMQLLRIIQAKNCNSLQEKIENVFDAKELEKKLSKDKILELYLNYLYFGPETYGIKQAANNIFGIDISKDTKITTAQCACLAAITFNPDKYNPKNKNGQKKIITARNIILKKMFEQNYITKNEYTSAIKEKVNFK